MKQENVVQTVFRVLLSLIFIVAGLGHVVNVQGITARLEALPAANLLAWLAPLEVHVVLAGVGLLFGGLGLFLGSWTRLSALLLAITLVPITLSVQLNGPESLGPLFKNIALFGGLIYFMFTPNAGLGMDHLFARSQRLRYGFPIFKSLAIGALVLFVDPLNLFTSQAPFNSVAHAQERAVDDREASSVAILVRTPKHLEVALKTLMEGISSKENVPMRTGTVVVCGKKGVQSLVKGAAVVKKVQEVTEKNPIEVVACGLSLKQAQLSQEDLDDSIRVVENGLREMIRLKSSGYIGVEL